MAAEIFLEAEDISKSFFGNRVLNDVNFEISYGEVLGLVGENGAGKSTLIKIITGVYKQDSGVIKMDGEGVEIPDVSAARRLGISVVFQELSLSPNLTVAENIFVGMMPSNTFGMLQRQRLYTMAQELIDKFKVNIKPDDSVGKLSIGNRQIVEILKALASNPKLLILDEPTSSLEDEEIKDLFALIEQLKQNSYSIIYISHHLSEVFDITDRIMVLRDGNKVGIYNKHEISMQELIRSMINKDVKEFFGEHEGDHAKSREVLLEVRNLSKERYYRDISFDLCRGEILGLAGIVGCGKTDICKTLYGILQPDGGTVRLTGERITLDSPSGAMGRGIMFLPEARKVDGLFLRDTVKQNIIVGVLRRVSRLIFMNREKINRLVDRFINLLNIKLTGPEQRVTFLSGGNQQKVLVSKCLATEPDVLIAIDPTRGIDIGSKAEIHRILNEIAEKGVGIILVSSELDEIIAMSDRILMLVNGVIVDTVERGDFDTRNITFAIHQGTEPTNRKN
jgi:ABC-type sugar transport system ATPase subunit